MSTFAHLSPSSFARAVPGASVVRGLATFVRALVGRHQVTRLLELDDRMLKDIGLVRSDVVGVLEAPLGLDPSDLLRLRAVERRVRSGAKLGAGPRLVPPARSLT